MKLTDEMLKRAEEIGNSWSDHAMLLKAVDLILELESKQRLPLPANIDCIWQRGGRQKVLKTYLQLHDKNIGAHWMWIAIERVAAGESIENVLAEYGYKIKW